MHSIAKSSISLKPIIRTAKGSWVFDTNNKRYLDLFSSYSSTNFGHRHPVLYKKFLQQSKRLSIYSRTLTSDILIDFGETLVDLYKDHIVGNQLKVIPMNSGVEACETAVKLARKWAYVSKGVALNQAKVLFAENNYWGRTLAAISTSGYEYQKYFYPKVPGFLTVPYADPEAIRQTIEQDPTISAVMLEPIQGEGGVVVPPLDYFNKVREVCTKHNVLLIADEIQTGMGRTGTGLCIEHYGIQADMILLGKSLGGGFLPVSVCMARPDVADVINPGQHSSTFGGYPLGCAMGVASLNLLHKGNEMHKGVLATVPEKSESLKERLMYLWKTYPYVIKEVRGKGMLWGLQLFPSYNAFEVCNMLVDYGLITREANQNVVRICPPLTMTGTEMDFVSDQLIKGFRTLNAPRLL